MPDDEVEIEAQWDVHTHDIIYVWIDNDGVEHEMTGDSWYGVDFGDDVYDIYAEPGERTGWHFTDTWLEETDGLEPGDYEYMPDRDLKFIAQYERNEYEYELVLDGGEFPDGTEYTPSGTYLYEATITSPTADPVKTGYTFDEWDPEIPANMPADDLTVTAQWIANTYKINYVKNGGTWTDANAEDYDVFTYDEDVSVRGQSDIEKTGYSFDKVTVDAAGETAFTGSYDQIIANAAPVSGGEANEYEVIVYVQWSVNDYELTIELDGGAFDEGVESPAGRYDFGEAFPEMPNPKKAGYDFRGWEYINAESDPTEVISKPATMPAYDVAATALWEKHVYTVVYAMNGGTPQLSNTSVEYDSLLTLPVFGTDFDKTGSSFSGWKCSVDDAVYNDNFRVPALATNGDTIIFTAQWDMIFYKITLDLDGGSVETPTQGWALENGNYVFTDVYNAQVNEPAVPEKAGYDFTGWYTEGNEKYTFTTMPNENIDLTAGWTPHKYNVVFLQPDDGATEPVFNDKAGFDYAEVYYGTGTTAPAEYPELQYYVPQGWATSTDGEIVDFSTWTMPAADKNSDFYFYPVFEREAITLQITSDNADVIRTSDTLPVNGYIYNAGNRLTKAKLSAQLEVTGNGSLRITPSKGVNICGTGTKVELVDNVTGEVVEAYYLVVCGDVNGDAVCNANDVSIAENALNKENSNWYLADEDGATEEQIAENARIRECYVKAADVTDNHGTFDDYDTALMELYVFGMATYDYDSTEHVYVAEAK